MPAKRIMTRGWEIRGTHITLVSSPMGDIGDTEIRHFRGLQWVGIEMNFDLAMEKRPRKITAGIVSRVEIRSDGFFGRSVESIKWKCHKSPGPNRAAV